MKILLLKGLPGSGKSTLARKIVAGDVRNMKGNWTRVNKDELRAMMHNGKHTKGNEAMVIKARDEIIIQALNKGHSVIVDDTNFNPIHEQRMWEIAKMYTKCSVEVQLVDTSLEECIARDLQRPNSVGERVIRRMYNENFAQEKAPRPEVVRGLPHAIICDIDGTLAHMKDRSPYDWSKVGEDTIEDVVADLIDSYTGDAVLLVSGRDSVCRDITIKWLEDHNVEYDELFMRPEGNTEKDTIIKRKLYEDHIKGKYNIDFVLDDRNSVVRMWRDELGLKVLQVAPGDF